MKPQHRHDQKQMPQRPVGSLGVLGQLADFLDDRTGYRALMHEALYERVFLRGNRERERRETGS